MSETTLEQMLSDESIPDSQEEAKKEDGASSEEAESSKEDKEADESTGEKDDSTPESDSSDKEEQLVPVSALTAERQKRQEAERKLAESSPKPEKDEKPLPDVLEDPKAFQNHLQEQIAAANLQTRISVSQAVMREKHDDYDEKEARFLELVKDDPGLVAQMQSSDLPAKFVYETVTKRERFGQFDNFDKALNDAVSKEKESLKKQIREELEKEYQQKFGKLAKLPPSGAAGSSEADDASLPTITPLKDILG